MANTRGRRQVLMTHLRVCSDGHLQADVIAYPAWQVWCPACGDWTWEDGNFCVTCGAPLTKRTS